MQVWGVVTKEVSGGFVVKLEDVETKAFIPYSRLNPRVNLSEYFGVRIEFKVLEEVNGELFLALGAKRFINSRKLVQAQELSSKLSVGQEVQATVVSTTDFGAFLKIDGTSVEGLLHRTKVGRGLKLKECHERFKVGDELKVKVNSLEANGKIGFSLNQELTCLEYLTRLLFKRGG